jgi:hypothetical protein
LERSRFGCEYYRTNEDVKIEEEKFAQSLFCHPDRQGNTAGDRLRFDIKCVMINTVYVCAPRDRVMDAVGEREVSARIAE